MLRDDEPLAEYLPAFGWGLTRYLATTVFWRIRLLVERRQERVARWKVGVICGSGRDLRWTTAVDVHEGLTFSDACARASVLAARYS